MLEIEVPIIPQTKPPVAFSPFLRTTHAKTMARMPSARAMKQSQPNKKNEITLKTREMIPRTKAAIAIPKTPFLAHNTPQYLLGREN